MYYDREYLEARLDYYYSLLMTISKGNIDVGIRDLDTLYFDLDNIAPAFVFRDRDEQYEYRSIVRDWNSRFRAEVDHYLREHDREEEERAKKRRKKEEEKRREEEEILMAAGSIAISLRVLFFCHCASPFGRISGRTPFIGI